MIWGKPLPVLRLLGITLTVGMLAGCEVNIDRSGRSDDDGGVDAGTTDGGTNNGTTNNGATNNGATNNGTTNNGVTNNGMLDPCLENERVEGGVCVPCELGTFSDAGADPGGDDTLCEAILCVPDQRVEANACVDCDPGTTSLPGADASGEDTVCDVVFCDADERVAGNACEPCPAGTTNDAGDDATGADTSCEAVSCAADERVAGNACQACPAGTTNDAGDDASGADTMCDAVTCAANERVESNACVACDLGQINLPGDDASGADTMCDGLRCPSNQYVSGNICTDCPAGTTNTAGDDASGADTTCDATICDADEYVSSNMCLGCPAGSTNMAGDDASGADTTCDMVTCADDEYVSSNTCVACPAGTTNTAGDDASGADTMCDAVLCAQDEYVSSNACVACAQGETNAAGDDASGGDTVCDDACTSALGVTCAEFEEAYIKASNTDPQDRFGLSIALSGDTLVVGVPNEDSDGTSQADNTSTDSGAAYVFTRTGTTWTQQAYLKPSWLEPGDGFGGAVDISGDTIAIGATSDDYGLLNDQGSVTIFTRTGTMWMEERIIYPSSLAIYPAGFGADVALDGDTLAVGSLNEGVVEVFVRAAGMWTFEQGLTAPFDPTADLFGRAVALSGDTIVVGAAGEDSGGLGVESDNSATDAGAAYVFVRSAGVWNREAFLKAPTSFLSPSTAGDAFGGSVAILGDTIAVGASGEDSDADGIDGDSDNNAATDSGAVYVFTRSGTTWTPQAYVKASNSEANDAFGTTVALAGDQLAVGARLEDSSATGLNGDQASNGTADSGAAYLFSRVGTTWSQDGYIKAKVTDPSDLFGAAVALDGNTLAISAWDEDSNATGVNGDASNDGAAESGAVYIRRIAP